jgi:hypothetical protein
MAHGSALRLIKPSAGSAEQPAFFGGRPLRCTEHSTSSSLHCKVPTASNTLSTSLQVAEMGNGNRYERLESPRNGLADDPAEPSRSASAMPQKQREASQRAS